MAKLDIITAPDPRLKAKCRPVARVDPRIRQLMDDMLETMYGAPGIGLAAPQVGVSERVLVLDIAGDDDPPQPLRMANPELVWVSDDDEVYNEGCLSVPDQYAEVERPSAIRARWQDLDGKVHEEAMEGMMATCLQHEMDHLEGILFIDHLSRLKRQMVLKKLEKARKLGHGHVHGPNCNH